MTCKVEGLVIQTVSSLDSATHISEAANYMANNDLGSILVTEAGKVIGLFTERDLLTRVVGVEKDPREHTLGEVCSRSLISISHDSNCQNALRLMQKNNCRRLLVYQSDNLRGLVNISDIAHALAEQRRLKNTAVNLVGGLTLTVVVAVIAMLIAILPDMLILAGDAMQ